MTGYHSKSSCKCVTSHTCDGRNGKREKLFVDCGVERVEIEKEASEKEAQ